MPRSALGISAFFHNSAAALAMDGVVVSALEEERATRIKNDPSFPYNAIELCLQNASVRAEDIDCVVFYERPFRRLLRSGIDTPNDAASLVREAMRSYRSFERGVSRLFHSDIPKFFLPHHLSHAASSFLCSGFQDAVVVVLDGVGETNSTTIWEADKDGIRCIWQDDYPNSMGLFYSCITSHLGFRVLQDEYKVMGLAALGEHTYLHELKGIFHYDNKGHVEISKEWLPMILRGTFGNQKTDEIVGVPRREAGTEITQEHIDLAASVQALCTQWLGTILKNPTVKSINAERLCLAGGVAHNCRAIGELQHELPFRDIFIQPAAGDAGCALGAALYATHPWGKEIRTSSKPFDPFLGPSYTDASCRQILEGGGDEYLELPWLELREKIVKELSLGKIIGYFQGGAEFGPRALGNRSILASPLLPEVGPKLNREIKKRESFRPFAPAVPIEHLEEYFETKWCNRYMLITSMVKDEYRAILPATTHVDGSARVQAVDPDLNAHFHSLLNHFGKVTGHPVLLNTSFNHSSEPMVLTPEDALKSAKMCNLDGLAMGNYYVSLRKKDQS